MSGASGFAGTHAVVAGGAGFLGSWTCEHLLDRGARVTCLDNLATGATENLSHLADRHGFAFVEHDLCRPGELEPTGDWAATRVDWVLHLASPASPVAYARLPVETLEVGSVGTMRLLRLAARTGARFLLASTSEVYGDPLVHPQPESYWGNVNPVGPRSMYDEAKRFSEAVTATYRHSRAVDATIARIFNSYGPRMATGDGRAVPTFVSQALAGEPLTVTGDGSQTRSLCYAEDTVAGLLALLTSGHPGPVNIGSDRESTVLEIAHYVRNAAGSDSPIEFVGTPGDDPRRRRPDLTLAREALDWSPAVPLDEGMARTIAWFRKQRARAADTAVPAT